MKTTHATSKAGPCAKVRGSASHPGRQKPRQRASRIAIASGLSACLALSIPLAALAQPGAADGADIAGAWEQAAAALSDKSAQTYTTVEPASGNTLLPASPVVLDPSEKLDLRERGVVTPVKLQNPWGSCWDFSIIAACETSILSDLGTTYADSKLDLSELQLENSTYKVGGVPASVDESQAGEGYRNSSQNPNAGMDYGGFPSFGSTMFAAGLGPLPESAAPYTNKGAIGSDDNTPIIACKVAYTEIDPSTGTNKLDLLYITEEEAQAIEKRIEDEGDASGYKSINRVEFAGNYQDKDGNMVYTDWSVDDSLYASAIYNLEDGNILPETRILDEGGACTGTDLSAVKDIQSELQAGRAVSMAFCSDQSKPNQTSGQAVYLNQKTWAHYTYDDASPNHAVTIVGYDNGYSKENFGGGDTSKQPEADGAWLVKNSWGAQTEEFPNAGDWGMPDEDGKSTGYFWLSYYDKSVCMFESYDFDVNKDENENQYYIDQYDYLPQAEAAPLESATPMSMANIFTATSDISLSTVSCATYKPNTKVRYEVYLLDSEAATPTDPDHSTLACTLEDTYEFGGYHRTKIDEGSWVAMRNGQRYSVVTTQQCLDNGKYYQGAAVNERIKPTEQQVAKYREDTMVETNEKYYEVIYPLVYAKVKASTDPDTGQPYTEEKAQQLASETTYKALGMAPFAQIVEKEVEASVDIYANAYFESVVNDGESWSGAVKEGADATQPASQTTVWADWKDNVKGIIEKNYNDEVAVDNAPVKAFAKVKSWASVEELDRLAAAIDAAQAVLATAKTSVDGTDVDASETWMTQESRDALAAAVEEAKAALALAGEDYGHTLANTTPDSATVNAAIEKLAVTAAAGTMQKQAADENADGDVNEGAAEAVDEAAIEPVSVNTGQAAVDKALDRAATTGKTGDEAAATIAALAAVICVAASVAFVLARTRRSSRKE